MENALNFQPEMILAKNGKSFYWASFFLSKKQKSAASMLYSFCRYIDDIVDEASNNDFSSKQIAQICEDIHQGQSQMPSVQAIIHLIHSEGLNKQVVYQLIDGVSWDLYNTQIRDENDLVRYCYGVASTVGLLMCQILQVKDPVALRYAIDLGIAMQLTNIARDVLEDAHNNRVYLPKTWFNEPPTPSKIIEDPEFQKQHFNLVLRILSMAEQYYKSADHGLCYIPSRGRLAILIASRVYHGIGKNIFKLPPEQYWALARVFTTKPQKCVITIKSIFEYLLIPKFKTKHRGKPHDKTKHDAIEDLVEKAFRGC